MPPLDGPFARELEAHRARFNTKFAEARRQHPKLDPAHFAEVLRAHVAPVVDAVAHVVPERSAEAADALYDLALDLLGQELLGPRSRYPFIGDGWAVLFPLLGQFFAESPRALAAALTNAHYNLATTPGARPSEWASLMLTLAEHCPDSATLLRAGQVAAWRTGLAHYRAGALDLCRALPSAITRAALGLPPKDEPTAALLDSLAVDPWFSPSSNPQSKIRNLKLVARVGAFRGFGGLFLAPPTVCVLNGQLHVRDGDETWLLCADAFGATFHRAENAPMPTAVSPAPFKLERSGKISLNGQTLALPELATYTSAASDGRTLAVTTALSHSVYLIALSG